MELTKNIIIEFFFRYIILENLLLESERQLVGIAFDEFLVNR